MKVLVNGGLNLSELDGWWMEAHQPQVGWALGDGQEHGRDPNWDAAEAAALYSILENEVIPTFYTRNAGGLPIGWLAKMRESMATLTARFSANRAIRQYTNEYYLPRAAAYEARRQNLSTLGPRLTNWRRMLEKEWNSLSFGDLQIETREGQHYFRLEVIFGGVDPEAVQVELFAAESEDRARRQPPLPHILPPKRLLYMRSLNQEKANQKIVWPIRLKKFFDYEKGRQYTRPARDPGKGPRTWNRSL